MTPQKPKNDVRIGEKIIAQFDKQKQIIRTEDGLIMRSLMRNKCSCWFRSMFSKLDLCREITWWIKRWK
jgi:hypothetical protein